MAYENGDIAVGIDWYGGLIRQWLCLNFFYLSLGIVRLKLNYP